MPPRGLTTKAAGSAQISLNKTKQLFAAAHNIKSPKTPLRAIVAESKRAGNKAGATPVGPCLASKPGTMRRSFAPVGVRVGPARRPGEEGLEFLNVAASTKTSLQLNDAGYAMSKQTSLELARSILVFKVCPTPACHPCRSPGLLAHLLERISENLSPRLGATAPCNSPGCSAVACTSPLERRFSVEGSLVLHPPVEVVDPLSPRTPPETFRGWQLCSIPLVVKNSRKLYDIASKVPPRTPPLPLNPPHTVLLLPPSGDPPASPISPLTTRVAQAMRRELTPSFPCRSSARSSLTTLWARPSSRTSAAASRPRSSYR